MSAVLAMRAPLCATGLVRVMACSLLGACAPGGVERVEHLDAGGVLQKVELPTGSSPAQVEARLGRPNAIQRGPGATRYWLYTFDHMRNHYVLTFRGEKLVHVRYMPVPGEAR